MRSLRGKLFVVWLLSVAAAGFVGWLLTGLYHETATAQLARADAAVTRGCEQIEDRYEFYTAGWAGPGAQGGAPDARLRHDLLALLRLALGGGSPELAGGIWQAQAGPVAALGPFREEGSDGNDLPRHPALAALNAEALAADAPQTRHVTAGPVTLVLRACPLDGPIAGLTAWAGMPVLHAAGLDALRLGLGGLLALVLGIAAAASGLALVFGRRVKRIETALAAAAPDELPVLAPTGEAELDRVVGALNAAGQRLREARRAQAELSARVAQSERLAALGRVAAGVAHEIRNPIAAMRLRAENALASGDPARRDAALAAVLEQVARLDRLSGELLTMTQPRHPSPQPVDLASLLAEAAADQRREGVTLAVAADPAPCVLDPALLRRALDALLDNAVRHAGPGGRVTLCAALAGGLAHIEVADSGPGVPPELRPALFEPFVSGRADGTGLGLAIARELVTALGGRLTLADPGGARPGAGAIFRMEVPCRPS